MGKTLVFKHCLNARMEASVHLKYSCLLFFIRPAEAYTDRYSMRCLALWNRSAACEAISGAGSPGRELRFHRGWRKPALMSPFLDVTPFTIFPAKGRTSRPFLEDSCPPSAAFCSVRVEEAWTQALEESQVVVVEDKSAIPRVWIFFFGLQNDMSCLGGGWVWG